MKHILIFGILSIPVVVFSRRTLFSIKSHGFYRFFAWECMIWLFAVNYEYWFTDPFSIHQVLSWIFLFVSLYYALAGFFRLKKHGNASHEREDKTLFGFEKTTGLIQEGIFRYIRHPLYASLIILTWGIFFKVPSLVNLPFAILSTAFLYITSRIDEKECIRYFGEEYKDYMKNSKMFIPFIF